MSLQIERNNLVAFLYEQIFVQVRIKTRTDYGQYLCIQKDKKATRLLRSICKLLCIAVVMMA